MQVYIQALLTTTNTKAGPQALLTAPLMDQAEHQLVLQGFNATDLDYDREAFVHGLFMQRAQETPHAPCVVFEDYVFSYAEVGRLSSLPICLSNSHSFIHSCYTCHESPREDHSITLGTSRLISCSHHRMVVTAVVVHCSIT